jgi:hypothetical protein
LAPIHPPLVAFSGPSEEEKRLAWEVEQQRRCDTPLHKSRQLDWHDSKGLDLKKNWSGSFLKNELKKSQNSHNIQRIVLLKIGEQK